MAYIRVLKLLCTVLFALNIQICKSQSVNFVLIVEGRRYGLADKFTNYFKEVEDANKPIKFFTEVVNFTRRQSDEAFADMCQIITRKSSGISGVIDLTWGGWIKGRRAAVEMGLPYIRVQGAENHPFVQAADDFLDSQDAIDAALIFSNQDDLDQSLYYIIGNSFLRIIATQMQDKDAFTRLKRMRPRPSNYVVWGNTQMIQEVYTQANKSDLLKRDTRWTLVFEDFKTDGFDLNQLADQTNILKMTDRSCCKILNNASKPCTCSDIVGPTLAETIVSKSGKIVAEALVQMKKDGTNLRTRYSCDGNSQKFATGVQNTTREDFISAVTKQVAENSEYVVTENLDELYSVPLVTPNIEIEAATEVPKKTVEGTVKEKNKIPVGTWTNEQRFSTFSNYTLIKPKPFYRVGIVLGYPWAWVANASDGNGMNTSNLNYSNVNLGLMGYCVDLLKKLAANTSLNFDYEIIPTARNVYGNRLENGTWTGVVGDLIKGDIDISVAALTMTTEREEVIDFVAPYFDQSGISILLRKKKRETNVFKFLSVLKPEVWFGILGAVAVVSVLLWALDRFSPYSYYNNKEAYPEGARDFTLGESIWFALTSLTPQGGGECPKALSGRVLVAAYWLFIVLMLATFTANLAAFLTVERMQTTVQSLEELGRQSRINYTAVKDSPYMQYFINMAGAEEELYKKWKEITLNSTGSDQAKYRVWDYPVKEQYTHILRVIEQTGPVSSPEEGIAMTESHTDGDFAFIHDASEVRYQYYINCNFTEVGEPFAEQPLAVAVQQGSHLQKEISKQILELQKERFFEQLSAKFWNSKYRQTCPITDDSKGITLQSLGGIFLATLVGLLLSMITLAYEVWQQKKKEKESNKVIDISSQNRNNDVPAIVNSGDTTNTSKDMIDGYGQRVLQVGSKRIQMSANRDYSNMYKNDDGLPTVSMY